MEAYGIFLSNVNRWLVDQNGIIFWTTSYACAVEQLKPFSNQNAAVKIFENSEAAKLLSQLRFAIVQGQLESEKGHRIRVTIFNDLLKRCDQLGKAIGIPTGAGETEYRFEQRTVQNANPT